MEDVKKFAAHFRTHQTILNADVTFTFFIVSTTLECVGVSFKQHSNGNQVLNAS